ncbi:glycosyltransferase [Neobacillus sp. KR4-4]|uniref:glycosyltransferase n=1 Tax=Neobacillus sp. KR4-4 TaxID=3344872 RepID=UPI0035CAB5AA
MRIVQINTFPYKATGSIMMGIHKQLISSGHDSYVVWGRGRDTEDSNEIVIKDDIGVKIHGAYTRITDKTGFASKRATKKLLKRLDEVQPEIIHLHNIHGYYLNVEMLFNYIRNHKIRVVWTLHDCWPITGHCVYFDMVGCERWKIGCHNCPQKETYPSSKVWDNSKWNWNKKKELFTGLDITLVTPSEWLKEIMKLSFMHNYPISVLYNGINLDVFRPTHKENVRKKYSPENKPIVLGVASEWTERKGLNDFIKLSKLMPIIQFVVVGLTKEQLKKMPPNIIALQRTSNIQELVELYSMADIYFNPTYEDNFPTTNLEALACGTPVLTYDTGGSPEAIIMGEKIVGTTVGRIVEKVDSATVDLDKVKRVLEEMLLTNSIENQKVSDNCCKVAKLFGMEERLKQYVPLYQKLLFD